MRKLITKLEALSLEKGLMEESDLVFMEILERRRREISLFIK